MITRIELHNFMSHRESVIEPSPGLTVLVGPNNCGKSAVVAALQVLSQNRGSKLFTRHGEKLCSVVVQTSDGHVIEWRRKESPSYRIDGQVFDRLGRSAIPDELQPLLRLPMVGDEDNDDFNVHFGNQKSPIFLLDSSAGAAAKFFASSSDAIRLVEMQQRHLQRATEARRQRKQLEAEAQVVNAELEALNATVPLAERLADLESLFVQLNQLQESIGELERSAAKLVERFDGVDLHAARTEALQSLSAPPTLGNPEPLARQIAWIEKTRQLSERLLDETDRLIGLPSPPDMEDVTELEWLIDQLEAGESRLMRLECSGQAMATLSAPPVLFDCSLLEATVSRLVGVQKDVAATSRRCDLLAHLAPTPELIATDGLDVMLCSLQRQIGEVRQYSRIVDVNSALASPPALPDESGLCAWLGNLVEAEQKATALQEALASLEWELTATSREMREAVQGQNCPTCGQLFDADQLLAMGAGGHTHV